MLLIFVLADGCKPALLLCEMNYSN